MTIKTETFLYELLIRFNAGGYQGSHAIDMQRVMDGDEVLAERPHPARPLTVEELAPLIGNDNARLVEATASAVGEVQTLRMDVADANHKQQQAEEFAGRLAASLEGVRAELADLRAKAEAA